jgi:hypothetical protein
VGKQLIQNFKKLDFNPSNDKLKLKKPKKEDEDQQPRASLVGKKLKLKLQRAVSIKK